MDPNTSSTTSSSSTAIRPHIKALINQLKDVLWLTEAGIPLSEATLVDTAAAVHSAFHGVPLALHNLELVGIAQACLQVATKHLQLLCAPPGAGAESGWQLRFATLLEAMCGETWGCLETLHAEPGLQRSIRAFMISSGEQRRAQSEVVLLVSYMPIPADVLMLVVNNCTA